MATFEIQGEDGATYQVEAPDMGSAARAVKKMGASGRQDATSQPSPKEEATPPAQEEPQTNILDDILGSAVTGVRRGVEGLAGAIGDANQMTGEIVSRGAEALGASRKTARTLGSIMRRANALPFAPTSEQVRGATTPVLGEEYQPQTTAGDYARSLGEFAPAAALGPGGLVRKTAMTAIPAIGSEIAGQLTEGTQAEPYARAAGALTGGIVAGGRAPKAVKEAAKAAPTAEQLKAQTDRLYGTLRNAGIKYDPNAYANSVTKMADDLVSKGFRPSVAKDAFALVDDLAKEVGKSPDFDDISSLVQMVGQKARAAARTGDKPTEAAFNIIRDNLNKMERSAPLVSQVNIPRNEINRVRSAAREVAKRNTKQRALSEIVENADTYASGQEAGLRNGIRNLVRSKRGKQLFDKAEQKALLDVANGRKGVQTLSRFGFDLSKISGNATFIPTLGALGAGGLFGPAAGVGLAAAGTAAKQLSPRLTSRAFEEASGAIRSGKMNDPTVMNAVKAGRIKSRVRKMLSVEPTLSGVSSGLAQPVQ